MQPVLAPWPSRLSGDARPSDKAADNRFNSGNGMRRNGDTLWCWKAQNLFPNKVAVPRPCQINIEDAQTPLDHREARHSMSSISAQAKAPAISAPPTLLNIQQLGSKLGGLGRPRIYALMREPGSTFPRQLKIGKTARWFAADVDAWLRQQALVQGLEVTA